MNANAGRHLDADTRMVWRTLCIGGTWTVGQLVAHWQPTYTLEQMQDILERLEANACARRGSTGGLKVWAAMGNPIYGTPAEARKAA